MADTTQTVGLQPGIRWGNHDGVVMAPGKEIGSHRGGTAGPEASVAAPITNRSLSAGSIGKDPPQRAIHVHDPDGRPIHLREDR